MNAPSIERRFMATRQPTTYEHVRAFLMQEHRRSFTLTEIAASVLGTKAPTAEQVAEVYAAIGRLMAAGCVIATKGGA